MPALRLPAAGRGSAPLLRLLLRGWVLLHAVSAQSTNPAGEWIGDPEEHVASRSEASCAADHVPAATAPKCRACGTDGLPGGSPPGSWADHDPSRACSECCAEIQEGKETYTASAESADELDVDPATKTSTDPHAMLAACCEGQCCEEWSAPTEDATGRYMYASTRYQHRLPCLHRLARALTGCSLLPVCVSISALAAILVLGGIAVAIHYCHRECQVTKRQELLAAQNEAAAKGSAAQYQVAGAQQPAMQQPMMQPMMQQQPMMMQPGIAQAQGVVMTGDMLPGQPPMQQQQQQQQLAAPQGP
jgi:hypothetical protein